MLLSWNKLSFSIICWNLGKVSLAASHIRLHAVQRALSQTFLPPKFVGAKSMQDKIIK